jgi:hypothetical protein
VSLFAKILGGKARSTTPAPAAVHTPSAGDTAIEPLPKLHLTLDLPAGSLVGVAGEHYHETALEQTIALDEGAIPLHGDDEYLGRVAAEKGRALRWFTARLVPEPDNPYDANAIAVYSGAGKVGYLPRERAPEYAEVFERLRWLGADSAKCPAFVDIAQRQIVLALAWPSVCLPEINALRRKAAWEHWKQGGAWEAIAEQLRFSTPGRAAGAARSYAEENGLEIPPTPPRGHKHAAEGHRQAQGPDGAVDP